MATANTSTSDDPKLLDRSFFFILVALLAGVIYTGLFYLWKTDLLGTFQEEFNELIPMAQKMNVKEYFEKEGSLKQRESRIPHNIDTNYWKIFNSFPRCSGVALGFDRLLMLLTKRSTIDAVIPFPLK